MRITMGFIILSLWLLLASVATLQASDIEEGGGSSLSKSASQQYVSYSNYDDHHQPPEFGLRKSTVMFESQHNVDSDYSNQQQSQPFDNLNGPTNEPSSFREFGPSIYNMPSMNGGGQIQQNIDGFSGGSDSGSASQEIGSFTPISLSVEEAFKKYFPSPKDSTDMGYPPQQQTQGQQQQQQQPSGGDYSNGNNNQQMNDQKDVVSIDSLREIVEKQPLARPDPFDPPSPPLSAFLPPPPNAQLVEPSNTPSNSYPSPSPQPTTSSDQMPINMDQPDSPERPQGYINQAPPQMNMNQFKPPETEMPTTQPFMDQSPPQSSKFIYQKDPESFDNRNVEPAFGEENDDEGYAYNTENIDENGKKVFVYSRPVQLPELTESKYDAYGSNMENQNPQMMGPIYRKPVSFGEEDKGDQGPIDHGGFRGDQYHEQAPRPYHNEINVPREKPPIDSRYQMNSNDIRPPPPAPPIFPEFNDYDQSGPSPSPTPPQQQSWNHNSNNMRPMDYDDKLPDRPQQIEYGGFIPIKKPMINQEMNNQPYGDSNHVNQQKPPYEFSPSSNNDYVQQPPPQMHQIQMNNQPSPPSPPGPQSQFRPNVNYESTYHGPMSFDSEPSLYPSGPNVQTNYQQQPNGHFHKIQNVHVKPLYGRDAMKKLRELGINEDEFYGTVNKILQKSRIIGKPNFDARPQSLSLPPYMPKANMYRAPPKNRPRPYQSHKNPFFNNIIAEDFELKFLKDELPPGASYNPRDVGLDESVLAQIHLLDSGIGGYRFPPLHPMPSINARIPYYHRPMSRKPVPYKKPKEKFISNSVGATSSNDAGLYTMNSMILPFIFPSPSVVFPHRRLPYSQTNTKGFYPVYGYRAAASELKPQFILPKGKAFKFLNQQQIQPENNNINEESNNSSHQHTTFANIFGIRSIKGIKSLVSYLTGGVSG